MAQTPIYLIDYPVSTDLVANGATAMGALAADVETALQSQTAALITGTRNRVANPTFTQAQLPAGTTGIADAWTYVVDNIVGVTNTRNTLAVTAGLPEWVSGSFTQATASNAAGIARYVAISHAIPDIRSISGATVVVSFYAKATAGTPKIGVNFYYRYGTGGAPSADVNGVGQAVTISTAWTRYSLTFPLITASGKTIGTNGDDTTSLQLWTSAGSNWNTNSGSIGLQTSTIEITGVQVERNYLTPLEVRSVDSNLRNSSEFGKWQTWTPAIRQGAADMATTVNYAAYQILGKTCIAMCSVTCGANGTAASAINIRSNGTLPTPRTNLILSGSVLIDDVGTGLRYYAARTQTGPSWNFYSDSATGQASVPTLATNDSLYLQVFFEIA